MNQEYKNTFFRMENPRSPLPERFGIVTAYNANGKAGSVAENQKLDCDLAQALKERGFFHWRVTGGSPDFSHAEPGFGIETDLGTILWLGEQFKQEAVFWIEHGQLYLVPIMPLGLWRTRIQRIGTLEPKFWDPINFDLADPLNQAMWSQSPSLQRAIQPPEALVDPGSIGPQQAMIEDHPDLNITPATVLPWVPDLVGTKFNDGGLMVVGPAGPVLK